MKYKIRLLSELTLFYALKINKFDINNFRIKLIYGKNWTN